MKRILVVEDEAHLVEMYKDLLDKKSFTVSSVKNSKDAISLLTLSNYDIVITDLYLAYETSGSEVIEYINEMHSESIELYVVSGFLGEIERLSTKYEKFVDKANFYSKPAGLIKLVEGLNSRK